MTRSPLSRFRPSRRFGAAVAAAVLLHGVLFVTLVRSRQPRSGPSEAPDAESLEVWLGAEDLALSATTPPTTDAVAAPAPSEPMPTRVAANDPHPRSGERLEERRAELGRGAPSAVVAEIGVGGDAPVAASSTLTPGGSARGLGFLTLTAGERAAIVANAPEGQTRALPESDNDRAARSLREAASSHDRQLGLGFGGPVASAARDAAIGPDAPVVGWAVFDIALDGDGRAKSVTVVDVDSSGRSAWDRVGRSALASLRARRLRVPSGSAGVRVRVRVEAKTQLPSGGDRALTPTGGVDSTGAHAGIGFDVADLSKARSRVVSSRVIDETPL